MSNAPPGWVQQVDGSWLPPGTPIGFIGSGVSAAFAHGDHSHVGLPALVKAGVPADSDYATPPPNGTLQVNSSTNILYGRIGGVWTALGSVGGGGLTGIVDALDYTAVAQTVVDDCEATTGWVGGTPATDTTYFTTGTKSVKGSLNAATSPATQQMYKNLAADQTLGNSTYLAIDLRYEASNPFDPTACFVLKVADAVDLGGTVVTAAIPFFPGTVTAQTLANWVTVIIRLTGLTKVRSFGVSQSRTVEVGGVNNVTWAFDNCRLKQLTELERALESSATATVLVPASYSPSQTQTRLTVPSGRTVTDLRPLPAVREFSTRDWNLPETGATDLTADLVEILNALPSGSRFTFPPGSVWLCNSDRVVHLRNLYDVTIDCTGARFYTNTQRKNPFFLIEGCRQIRMLGGRIFGFHAELVDVTTSPAMVAQVTNLLNEQQAEDYQGNVNQWFTGTNSVINETSTFGKVLAIRQPRSTGMFGNATNEINGYSLRIAANGSPATITTNTGTSGIPVVAGVSYDVSGYFRADSTGRTCRVDVQWFNSDGTACATASSTGPSGSDITSGYTKIGPSSVTAPNGGAGNTAAFAAVVPTVIGGSGGEFHYVDFISFQRTSTPSLTTSGNGKTLTNPGDEVGVGTVNSYYHFYARDKDGYCSVDVVLSDNNHVANDCFLHVTDMGQGAGDSAFPTEQPFFTIIKDPNGTPSTVATDSGFVTLTGTPTTYRYRWQPIDIHGRIRFGVRKATRTANTITVASITGNSATYNYSSGTFESNAGIQVSDSQEIVLDGQSVEGIQGYGHSIFGANTDTIECRNLFIRAVTGQGWAMVRGKNVLLENSEIGECPQTCIDFESSRADWLLDNVTVRNVRLWNAGSIAMSAIVWGAISNLRVENVRVNWARLGAFDGGARGGSIRGLTMVGTVNGAGIDIVLRGRNMEYSDIYSQGGIQLINDTSQPFDLGTGQQTAASDYNRAAKLRVMNPGSVITIQNAQPHTVIEGSAQSANTVTVAGHTIAPFQTAGDGVAMDAGPLRTRWPSTFKGVGYTSFWTPGGRNGHQDPDYNLRGISATSTKPNNLSAIAVALGSGVTSKAITFPTRTIGAVTNGGLDNSLGGGDGTLVNGTTYHYRLAAQDLYGGPGPANSDQSTACGAGLAIGIGITLFDSGTWLVPGFTIYRGTALDSYDTRYEVLPNTDFFGPDNLSWLITDKGTTITLGGVNYFGYPSPISRTTQTAAAAVDESGYERDTSYGIMVQFSYNAGAWWITNKAKSGFTINWVTATPDANQTLSWMLVR